VKYVRKPVRADHYDEDMEEWIFAPGLTVYDEGDYQETGLLDADGMPLVRVREKIGFR
jgi:hypothetical protein